MTIPQVDKNAPLAIEQVANEDPVPALEKRNRIWFVLGTIILVFVISAVGIIVWTKSTAQNQLNDVVVAVVEEPTSIPTPVLSQADLKLEIWNGSGVPGAAAKKAAQLEKSGFVVISLGNAPQQSVGNQLFVRNEYTSLAESLFLQLGVDSVTGELTTGTAAARLILGK